MSSPSKTQPQQLLEKILGTGPNPKDKEIQFLRKQLERTRAELAQEQLAHQKTRESMVTESATPKPKAKKKTLAKRHKK